MRNARRPIRPKQKPREYFRCVQCCPVAAAHSIWSINTEIRCCLKTVWDRCVGSIARLVSTVALSDRSDVVGATLAGASVGDTFQDRRQPGHQDAAAIRQPGEPLDGSPLPNCPIQDVVLPDRDKQLLSELRRALPRCVVFRYATAWAASLEGARSGHQSWAVLCRFRCRLFLAEIPKRCRQEFRAETATSTVGTGANQQSDLQSSGSAELWTASQNSKRSAATVRRTAREASLCLDSPRIHQQSHERTGRLRRAGLCRLPQELDCSLHPAELGHWNSPLRCGVCRGGPNRLEQWRAIQAGAESDEGARSKQNNCGEKPLQN